MSLCATGDDPGGVAAAARRVDVCLRREDAVPPPPGTAVAVVDVLRATSTVVTALAAGAAAVRPVEGVAEALGLRAADPSRLVAGERQGRPPPGFDFGNSPGALLDAALHGREVVLSTTNGSAALAWAGRHAAEALALALLNLGAVARRLAAAGRDVLVLCAGREGGPGLDDLFVAGALVARLAGAGAWAPGELARLALLAWRGAGGDAAAGQVLRESAAGRHLAAIGLGADIDFCARVDAFAVVPAWRGGVLRAGGA